MGDDTARTGLFALEIKVEGFVTTNVDGSKAYTKGKVIKWDVEIGSLSLDLLLTSLSSEIKVSTNQAITVWFYDKTLGEDVRLVDEIQMIDLFEMYKSEMQCQVIASVLDKSLCVQHEHEYDDLEPLCVVPPDSPVLRTNTAVEPDPKTGEGVFASKAAAEEADASKAAAEEADASEPDIFDNEEEYVGVNDEHIYMPVPPAQPTQPADSVPDSEHVPDSDHVAAEGAEPPDAEVDDADPDEIHVIFDPENPKIEKGALFPDILTFRKAIRHYAIVKGFEFTGIQTDKTRFIAKCKHNGCPWRIHASRLFDGRTIQMLVPRAGQHTSVQYLQGKVRKAKRTYYVLYTSAWGSFGLLYIWFTMSPYGTKQHGKKLKRLSLEFAEVKKETDDLKAKTALQKAYLRE